MANRWGNMETVRDFILGGSKITADGDCCHEIKRCLLLERKVITNLDSILKSRDITLSTKVHLVKATVFPVVMYGCESWTIKKAKIMASSPITSWQIDGETWKQWETLFWGAPKSLQMGTAAMKLKDASTLEEKLWPRQHIKKQRHHFANKGTSSQNYGFSSSHVWMWELDCKES